MAEKQKKHRIRNFFADFKAFISKGNILDMAIAFIMGAAFGAIVKSLVNDIISPLIASMSGGKNLAELTATVGSATLRWGAFVQAIIDFVIIAFVLFLMLKLVMKFKQIADINKQFADKIQAKYDNDEELSEREKAWLERAKKKGYKNIPAKKEPQPVVKSENEQIIELLASINEKLENQKTKK